MNGEEKFPSFTVAIPTYRRGNALLNTIEDVLGQSPAPEAILVVDQTEDHDPHIARRLAGWDGEGKIRWLRKQPPNLPAARNLALGETATPILIFLDDDVRLKEGFFAAHLRAYLDPQTEAVTGRVVQEDEWSRLTLSTPEDAPDYYLNFDYTSLERRAKVARVSGCNHSWRVAALRRIGGFDEGFTGSAVYEDVDAGLRLWRAGGRIVYEPEAVLVHLVEKQGGCRFETGEAKLAGVVYPTQYFLFKNFFPSGHFWRQFVVRNPRRFIFNLQHLRRPWQIPGSFWIYARESGRAWMKRSSPIYFNSSAHL